MATTTDRLSLSLSSADGEFAPGGSNSLSSGSCASLAEAAFGLDGARSIGMIDATRDPQADSPRRGCRPSAHSNASAAVPAIGALGAAHRAVQAASSPSRRADTSRPETLTDSFIERRLANLQIALGKLVEGGVAHAKLAAQVHRLQSEAARRCASELPPTASPTSLQPGVVHPSGSARSAILAARASPQALCRFAPLPKDADP